MNKLTDEEILEMGHRRARTYRHNDEPQNIGYGFDRATLLAFARAIESKTEAALAESIGAGGVGPLVPVDRAQRRAGQERFYLVATGEITNGLEQAHGITHPATVGATYD